MKKNYSWGLPCFLNTNRPRRPSPPSNVLPTVNRLQAQREGTYPARKNLGGSSMGRNYYKRGVDNPAVHPLVSLWREGSCS